MYSIASLLDPAADQAVREIWAYFETRCGLTGIKVTPLPHFSWHGADAYQVEPVEEALADLAAGIQPFTIHAGGLGIFTGAHPVIYLPIVKTARLVEVHRQLWERVRPFTVVPSPYYEPDRWVAHITLAYREMDAERLGCAVAGIAMQRLEIQIRVDHFALIYQTDGRAGLRSRFPLGLKKSLQEEGS